MTMSVLEIADEMGYFFQARWSAHGASPEVERETKRKNRNLGTTKSYGIHAVIITPHRLLQRKCGIDSKKGKRTKNEPKQKGTTQGC